MVREIEIEKINILNVNVGLLKCDNEGYFITIPMFPKFKNKHNITYLESKNAPTEFFDNLRENLEDVKGIKYYTKRIKEEDLLLTKEKADFLLVESNFDIEFQEDYNFFKNNSLKDFIKYLTDKQDIYLPMFTYNIIF